MQLKLNGEMRTLPDGLTVSGLIEVLALSQRKIAVEVNEAIVPKAEHGRAELSDGDEIEIIEAVGGG